MFSNLLIIALILALLYLYYQNQQLKKPGPAKELPDSQLTQTRWAQEKRALEAKIYQTDRDIVQARRYFWQLRLLINEWNVFKGMGEIKELIEKMRNNPVLEERIQ